MRNPNDQKTPTQLKIAILVSLAVVVLLTLLCLLLLPSWNSGYLTFWSAVVGCLVGTAFAFCGAAWLWRIERHVLIEERIADRHAARLDERRREDTRSLRQCLSAIGNLQALNYHMINESPFATSRDKYLMQIRIDEAASMIFDQALYAEVQFMVRLADDYEGLNYYVSHETTRLSLVRDWLLRLIAQEDGRSVIKARPANYAKLCEGLKKYDEYQQEMREAQEEHEKDRREEAEIPSA